MVSCRRLLQLTALLTLAVSTAQGAPPDVPRDLLLNSDLTVYRRSPTELWVYDNRPELGIGCHGFDEQVSANLHTLGIRLVRKTLYWNLMENTPESGVYDPEYLAYWDRTISLAQEQGIELLVIVHGNPPGVGFADRYAGYVRFARFVADMAARYPSVRLWELFNEMDAAFTDLFGVDQTRADGTPYPMEDRGRMYAEMLRMVYPALKRANPEAWVLTGGIAEPQSGFLRGVYEGGGKDYFDVVNIHTYGVPVVNSFIARGLATWQTMRQFGDENRPLWNTEWGIDAGNIVGAWGWAHEDPESNAAYLDETHRHEWEKILEDYDRRRLYQKVTPYQFYAHNERPVDATGMLPDDMDINDFGFGLMRYDATTPRPTFTWLQERQFNAPILAEPVRTVDVEAYLPDRPVPQDVEYDASIWREGMYTFRNLPVNSLYPTVIRLRPPE